MRRSGGHSHAVDDQTAASFLLIGAQVRILVEARANRVKSVPMNFARRLSSRTVMKNYRFERKGRRSFRAALEYDVAGMIDSEKTRTTKPVVRATCLLWAAPTK